MIQFRENYRFLMVYQFYILYNLINTTSADSKIKKNSIYAKNTESRSTGDLKTVKNYFDEEKSTLEDKMIGYIDEGVYNEEFFNLGEFILRHMYKNTPDDSEVVFDYDQQCMPFIIQYIKIMLKLRFVVKNTIKNCYISFSIDGECVLTFDAYKYKLFNYNSNLFLGLLNFERFYSKITSDFEFIDTLNLQFYIKLICFFFKERLIFFRNIKKKHIVNAIYVLMDCKFKKFQSHYPYQVMLLDTKSYKMIVLESSTNNIDYKIAVSSNNIVKRLYQFAETIFLQSLEKEIAFSNSDFKTFSVKYSQESGIIIGRYNFALCSRNCTFNVPKFEITVDASEIFIETNKEYAHYDRYDISVYESNGHFKFHDVSVARFILSKFNNNIYKYRQSYLSKYDIRYPVYRTGTIVNNQYSFDNVFLLLKLKEIPDIESYVQAEIIFYQNCTFVAWFYKSGEYMNSNSKKLTYEFENILSLKYLLEMFTSLRVIYMGSKYLNLDFRCISESLENIRLEFFYFIGCVSAESVDALKDIKNKLKNSKVLIDACSNAKELTSFYESAFNTSYIYDITTPFSIAYYNHMEI